MKVEVVLDLAHTSDIEIALDAASYTLAIAGSSNFKTPAVSAAVAGFITEQVSNVNTGVTNLKTAIAVSPSSTKVDNIKIARTALNSYLTALANSVEAVANGVTVPDANKIAIIHSAGMNEKNHSIRQKQVFSALMGDAPGSVTLLAASIKRGSHEWRYSADLTGNGIWLAIDSTLQAAAIVTGLTGGQEYAFEHRTIEKDGPTFWEGPMIARAKQ